MKRNNKVKNAALILLWLIIAINVGLKIKSFAPNYFKKFDPAYWKYRYENSQWVIPPTSENQSKIIPLGDQGLYTYAAWEYVHGTNPTTINPEMPPVGKYILGITILIFNNQNIFAAIVGVLALLTLFKLSHLLFKDKLLATLPVVFLSLQPLFLNELGNPELDLLYLLFFLLTTHFFLKGNFSLSNVFLGLFIGTKSPALSVLVILAEFLYLLTLKKNIKSWIISLPISIIPFLLSYASYFLNGNGIVEFLKFEKWVITFYQSGAQANLGSVFPLLLYGDWYNWFNRWSEKGPLFEKIGEWNMSWPALLMISLIVSGYLIIRRKKDPSIFFAFWIVLYILFLGIIPVWPRYLLLILPFLWIISQKGIILFLGNLNKFKKTITHENILLLAIIILGLFPRIIGALKNDFAFTYDVGRDFMVVKDIIEFHKIPLIGPTTGLTGIFYGPWWYYLLSIFYVFGNGNPAGAALFMGFLGALMIPLAFVFGKDIGSKKLTGFIFAAIVAFSLYLIGTSSQIWNPNPTPLLVLISLFCLAKIFFGKTNNLVLLTLGLSLGFILSSELAFGIFFLAGVAISVLFYQRENLIKNLLKIIAGFLITALPQFLFDLRHGFLITKSLFSFLIHPTGPRYHLSLFGRVGDRISAFWQIFASSITNNNLPLNLIIVIFLALSLIFLWKKYSREEKKILKSLLTVITTLLICFTLYPASLWSYYLIGLPVVFITTFVIIVSHNLIQETGLFKIAAIVLTTLTIIANFISTKPLDMLDIFTKPKWSGDIAVFRNQLSVLDYVYREANGRDFNYIAYTPPLHDYTWRYLFYWYGRTKYGYSPSTGKKDLYYVIIEPDYEIPGRIKLWLDQRKGDGVVEKDETVISGVRVQTRKH